MRSLEGEKRRIMVVCDIFLMCSQDRLVWMEREVVLKLGSLARHPYTEASYRWPQIHRYAYGDEGERFEGAKAGGLRFVFLLSHEKKTNEQDFFQRWWRSLFSSLPDICVETAFALPEEAAASLFSGGMRLCSRESARPLDEADVLIALLDSPQAPFAFLRMLEQAKIPHLAATRREHRERCWPQIVGMGRLLRHPAPYLAWLDDVISPSFVWPREIFPDAMASLEEEERELFWMWGRWHLEGCVFCRDALLREQKSAVIARITGAWMALLQGGEDAPLWSHWSLLAYPNGAEAGALGGWRVPSSRQARWRDLLRAMRLDRWLDRLLTRQADTLLSMAWSEPPQGLLGDQETEEAAWHSEALAWLPQLWDTLLAQEQRKILLDVVLGDPMYDLVSPLAWGRLARKAAQISGIYQESARVTCYLTPWKPAPWASLQGMPQESRWEDANKALHWLAAAWGFRCKAPSPSERLLGWLSVSEDPRVGELFSSLLAAGYGLIGEGVAKESERDAMIRDWMKRHAIKEVDHQGLSVSAQPSQGSQGLCKYCGASLSSRRRDLLQMEKLGKYLFEDLSPNSEEIISSQGEEVVKKRVSMTQRFHNQHRYRLHYGRLDYAALFVQKEFLGIFQTALRCSGLPFLRERGEILVRYGADLPMGMLSLAEYADLFLDREVDEVEALNLLRRELPTGVPCFSLQRLSPQDGGLHRSIRAWRYLCPLSEEEATTERWQEIAQRWGMPCLYLRKGEIYHASLQKLASSLEKVQISDVLPSFLPWDGAAIVLSLQAAEGKIPRPTDIFSHLLAREISSRDIIRITAS
jgi:hypothetical protein